MSHEGASSKPTCPKCGSKTVVPIIYGLPAQGRSRGRFW